MLIRIVTKIVSVIFIIKFILGNVIVCYDVPLKNEASLNTPESITEFAEKVEADENTETGKTDNSIIEEPCNHIPDDSIVVDCPSCTENVIEEVSPFSDKIERDDYTKCGDVQEEKITTLKELLSDEKACRGTHGRLFLPSVDFDVALFYVSSNYQSYVDDNDSAAMFDWHNNIIVADHNYQGFNAIQNISVNDIAYIETPDDTTELICIDTISDAINGGTDLLYSNGSSICDVYNEKYIIYTCNNDAENTITVTIWDLY